MGQRGVRRGLQELDRQVPGLAVQVHLAGGTWLDIGGTDVLGPPLQAEVVGRVSVLLAGQIELKILLAELRAQECSKHRNSSCADVQVC